MNLFKKNVLVTGADGFIGSHLTEILLKTGCNVRALSLYNSFNSWGWLETVPKNTNLDVVCGDIRDPFFCKEITKEIDVVFHLAALIAIPYSYIAPASYVDTNVKGTLNIVQAARENGCGRVIHTSTSEVYGTAQYVPIDEKHPLQPQSPYSASKIGADHIAMSFHFAFGFPVSIARPFNTYGPRQSNRAVLPSIITQIAAGKKRIRLGDTTPTRNFNYVADTCRGMISIAESDLTTGEIVNIGSESEIAIGDAFQLIKELMNSKAEIITDENRVRPENSEVFRLCCDNTKLFNMTGFKPEYTFRDGLIKTIAWLTQPENLRYFKTDIYNV